MVNSNYDASSISAALNLSGTSTDTVSQTGAASSDNTDSDSVSISAAGSASSLLISLIQERQSTMASRAELVSTTMENEGSTDSIEEQLSTYDSQLEDINAQISKARAQVAKEQSQNVITYSKNTFKASGSSQTNRMNDLVGLSSSLGTAQAAASSMKTLDRQANSLEAEIEADESRGVDTSEKEESLEGLSDKATSAAATIADSLNDINQKILEGNGDALVELDYPTPTLASAASTDAADDETDAIATADTAETAESTTTTAAADNMDGSES